jgi:anti-repressor protein
VNAPAIFQNDEFQLRVTTADDSFRVEAPGLARALGFRDSYALVRSVPDTDKGYTLVSTPGGEQQVWYLTEPGFYRALGQRQAARIKDTGVRAQVARFQSWVYGDVLPEIRKTGTYRPPVAAVPDIMPDLATPAGVLVLAEAFHATAQRLVAAERRAAELEPAAEAYAVLVDTNGDYSLRDAAHILNRDPAISTGQNRLKAFLRDEGLIDRKGIPYVRYARYLVERPVSYTHPHTGEPVLTSQIRITPEGLAHLRKRMGGISREVA